MLGLLAQGSHVQGRSTARPTLSLVEQAPCHCFPSGSLSQLVNPRHHTHIAHPRSAILSILCYCLLQEVQPRPGEGLYLLRALVECEGGLRVVQQAAMGRGQQVKGGVD